MHDVVPSDVGGGMTLVVDTGLRGSSAVNAHGQGVVSKVGPILASSDAKI